MKTKINAAKKYLLSGCVWALFLFVALLPSVRTQAADSCGYSIGWISGQEPKEIVTANYTLSYRGLMSGNKVIKSIPSAGVLYGTNDFYYVNQTSSSVKKQKAVVYKMSKSGTTQKIATVSNVSGSLYPVGRYKGWLYCTDSKNIYQITLKTGTVKKKYTTSGYMEPSYAICSNGQNIFEIVDGKLLRFNMGNCKVYSEKNVDELWESQNTIYISVTNGTVNEEKMNCTIKKFNSSTSTWIVDTQIKKAKVLYANSDIIVYRKDYSDYYLYLRKIKKTVSLKTEEYWDDPVLKGNYCYYITYQSGKASYSTSSTLWKVSLKTGKITKVRTVKKKILRFTGMRASYRNWNTEKYVYYELN